MGHGIDTLRDFQYGLEMAWHKLTKLFTKLEPELMPEVVPCRVSYTLPDGTSIQRPNRWIPIATDDGLPCGNEYSDSFTLWTPRDGARFANEVLKSTAFTIESMGMIKNRSEWFTSIRLDELKTLKVGDGRDCKFNLGISGGLDGTLSPSIDLSSTIIVCANTLAYSRMTGDVLFRRKLTKNFHVSLEESKEAIEKAIGYTAVFKATMDSLARQKCNVDKAERLFAGYFTPETKQEREDKVIPVMSTKTENMVNTLKVLHRDGIGNSGETLFDALNAVTQLYTRGTEESKKDKWSRFESSEFGAYADTKADFGAMLSNTGRLIKTEKRGEAVLLATAQAN